MQVISTLPKLRKDYTLHSPINTLDGRTNERTNERKNEKTKERVFFESDPDRALSLRGLEEVSLVKRRRTTKETARQRA